MKKTMWVRENTILVTVAVAMNILAWRVAPVLGQDELDPVRNNLSLPQVGLSILTSLSAVVGAVLKGELRAESSHKDLLLSLHALMNRDFFDSSEDISSAPTHSLLWWLALWLERCCGYTCLKNWCSVPSSKTTQACMIVEESNVSNMFFFHKMAVSWFRFNCDHIVRLVVASHPQDCRSCLEIPHLAWPGVRSFMPGTSLEDVQISDQLALVKCPRHGGGSPLSQALMEGSMGYTDHRRLAIMLIEPEAFDKACLPKAYCSLDAVERNMLTEMARVLVAADREIREDAPRGGEMSWSCGRRAVTFVAEVSLTLILCWAAQMPPLSASLVGRRLVRSHATGAWGNSSLVIAAGNQAQVCIESQDLSFFDISTSLPKSYTLIASLETLLVPTAIIAEYVCWTLVLTGVLPPVFGAVPKASGHLGKACSASLGLTLCFFLCVCKNCPRFFPPRRELGQTLAILCLHTLSQVAIWCIYVFARARLRAALLGVCTAGFGEFMWLAAMWAGAHHASLAERVTWQRTAAHVAPYLTDAVASLMLYL